MTRVPPQRLPASRPAQPRPAAQTSQAQRAKKPKPGEKTEKPQKTKGPSAAEEGGEATQTPETQGGPEAGKERDPHDAAQHEALWAPDSHAETAEKKDAKETAHAEKERKEEAKEGPRPGGPKPQDAAKGSKAGPNAAKRQSDGFERTKDASGQALSHAAETHGPQQAAPITSKNPIAAVAATRPVLAPPSSRPPDAFALLHQAQDKGVYFKEDDLAQGAAAEAEDPELAAAVEEAIRLLFGVRGILRVGPGKNMENEPVVVVVATQGFGEAALKTVPQQIHRFPTLLAIPFDLLPLKKER